MFPLRDDIDTQRTPWITWALIAANVAVFLWELTLGGHLNDMFYNLGLVPAFYSDPQLSMDMTTAERLRPFVTSMFLHGGWTHVIGNVWMLWIFGDNVEDYLGHVRFVIFYLGAGVIAAVVHLVTNWGSTAPTVGASGAIAGVMGAYFVLYPRARVLAVVPLFIILWPVVLPAVLFIGLWFVLQFLNGTSSLVAGMDGGVAWWAHIGGFVGGILLLGPLGLGRRRRARVTTAWPAGRLRGTRRLW